jgi:ABC-type branched-subunit amino acid transport system ATPase component
MSNSAGASPTVAATALRAESALNVKGLSMRFGGVRVFDDISFALSPGEVLGVIGPNGAGKTTLINVISGMLPPTSGKVLLGAADVTAKPFHAISRKGVVRSFQQTNTFRSASARENLARAARFSASDSSSDIGLDSLLQEFGLSDHLDEPSDKLPYGLQKMLGLLMTLAARPRFLLLDEPAAGLERRERTRIDRFVTHARSILGCGVLIVEHDMDLIRRLCPHILVLEAGRLLASGAPDDVLSRQEVIEAYIGVSEDESC